MDELLEADFAVAGKNRLYRCLDRIVEHKQELFVDLKQKWAELFAADFYEVMDGNTSEQKTLQPFLDRIEKAYGQARRVRVMDRGIPTEATLKKMRQRKISYLVGAG